MKQAKKMLCMLLVMLLAFSTVSIGVNAAYTSYATPTGTSLHEEPLLSTEQRGSQLLDFVDAMLYDMRDDLYIDITIMKLDFTSVDKALDTIKGLKSAAGLIGGDVGDLDIDALGSTRRGTAGKTDLDILYELLYFLNENRGIVGNFVRGDLDLGIISTFVELDFNIHNLLIDMLYEAMVDENYDVDVAPVDYNVWTADKILQHAIDVILLGGKAADGDVEEGFLPSMAGKTNINTQTLWAIIENAANAATKDLLLPFIKNDLGAILEEAKAANPSDAWRLIDISKLNLDNYVWGTYDSKNGIVAELNHFLYVVISQVWTGDAFWVDGGNDKLEQNLAEAIKIVYKELGTLILPPSAEFLPQDEIDVMSFQELVSYVAMQFLRSEMPYLLFETADSSVEIPTDNLSALACTIAYSILAELPINIDYMTDYEWGNIEWNKETALNMVADIGAYYLNGALPIEINYGEGVEMLITKLVNWALGDNNFGGFFAGCGVSSSDSAWTKIDKTVFAVLPLHKILGGGATGSYDLIMNKLLDNVLELNLDGILSLLYKADYSLLNMTAPKFIIEIVNRVLNVIIARNSQPAVFSTSLTSIDALVQNGNLGGAAERLLQALYNGAKFKAFWSSLLPILNPLLIDESTYSYNIKNPPAGYGVTTLEGLQAHVENMEAVISEPDDVYELDASLWNESEDYELWRYDQLEAAIDYAWGVIDGYAGSVAWVEEANQKLADANATGDATAIADAQAELAEAQADLASYNATKYANAAYEIDYYAEKAVNDQNIPAVVHLEYVIYIIEYTKSYDSSAYPDDVWANYEDALNHAYTILSIPTEDGAAANPELKQSMVNAARRNLLDAMRLLEIDLADLTALAEKLEDALAADTEGKTEDSVARLNDLIAKAEEFLAGSWIIDFQAEIDALVADLQAAIDGLEDFVAAIIPELEKIDTNVIVEEGLKLIAHLATQLTPEKLLEEYINSDENGTLEVDTVVDGVVGTGTVLTLRDKDGKVIDEYEVVIFGDANGDGIIDIMDTICLDLHCADEAKYADSSAQWYALNLNADAAVDASDVVILDSYANFEAEIDQQSIYA